MKRSLFKYLSNLSPFNFLPETTIAKLSEKIIKDNCTEDEVLFVQGKSKVDSLYIIQSGALEIYYQEGRSKTLQGFLSEGEIYGGISILLNDGLSVRTVRTHENSTFLKLNKSIFLELCQSNEEFSSFFTDTFGKRMLDRSYSAIMSKTLQENNDLNLNIFNKHVSSLLIKEWAECAEQKTIRQAASIMSAQKKSALLIKNKQHEYTGIITDKDFREKVVVKGADPEDPVNTIMSSPIIYINNNTSVFDAIFTMSNHHIKHLVVQNDLGKIKGIITDHDMIVAQGQSPLSLLQQIVSVSSMEQLHTIQPQLPAMIRGMIHNGARSEFINRFITRISDEILKRIIRFALAKHGEPPVKFVFMIMGSEGRREQTLKTDQDNAILYEDTPKDNANEIHAYFLALGKTICTQLNQAGYTFCKGNVMAQNPKWCQPLAKWKSYFSNWINTPEPLALMHSSIFFDFRSGYGDDFLVEKLRDYLFEKLSKRSDLFYFHLTKNAQHFRPPLGFFRNFVLESHGKHKDAFDIKKAMTPIVDFTRLYSLYHKIEATNTLSRLLELKKLEVFEKQEYDDLKQAYTYLMQLRFVRQLSAILDMNEEADNYIIPKQLTHIEQRLLKEIFSLIEKFQQKMSLKFTANT
ncbi:MAG: CBS domain-containing protein [Calditrichaeota bacterium]|nr:MAG: CBS domain-containing protein [Calditrichota bacterium]MBL1207725.1 CBS domain-containing protein [Calditrichota bacterium]NOG47559.1 CBS domain-containing protein [Calditrichota bacterium]